MGQFERHPVYYTVRNFKLQNKASEQGAKSS